MDARVHARGDEGLDLQAGQEVLVVTIVRGDARACRREGVGRSCMASSTPERTLRQESSRSARASSSCPRRSRAALGGSVATRRVRAASVRASYSAMMSWFGTRKAWLKWSTMVDTRGRHMIRQAPSAERDAQRRAKAQPTTGDARGGLPPGVVRQVPIERSADRGPQLSVKSDQLIMAEHDARTDAALTRLVATLPPNADISDRCSDPVCELRFCSCCCHWFTSSP